MHRDRRGCQVLEPVADPFPDLPPIAKEIEREEATQEQDDPERGRLQDLGHSADDVGPHFRRSPSRATPWVSLVELSISSAPACPPPTACSSPGPSATIATTMIAAMARTDPPVTAMAARRLLQPRAGGTASGATEALKMVASRIGATTIGTRPRISTPAMPTGYSASNRQPALSRRGPASVERQPRLPRPPMVPTQRSVRGDRGDEHGYRNGGKDPDTMPATGSLRGARAERPLRGGDPPRCPYTIGRITRLRRAG